MSNYMNIGTSSWHHIEISTCVCVFAPTRVYEAIENSDYEKENI